MLSYYFLERLSRWVAERPSIFENVPAAKSINMLPICENKSYCWLLTYIYIQDFMTNHPHLLVFINSFTKKSMILGLKCVDFHHPYTRLEYRRNRKWINRIVERHKPVTIKASEQFQRADNLK